MISTVPNTSAATLVLAHIRVASPKPLFIPCAYSYERANDRERNTRRQCGSGANVETSDDRMQIASLTRRMQVHNTDVYTPLGVGVYTCVNGPTTGAVDVSLSL